MARISNNIVMDQVRGAIGKQLVLKNRKGKGIVSKYPDMSKVVPSAKQLAEKSRFGDAIRFARGIISDPLKKAAYKVTGGRSVYHTAITDYLEALKKS
jgi:hypothetical protein